MWQRCRSLQTLLAYRGQKCILLEGKSKESCEMRAEVEGNSLGRRWEREARGDADRFDVTNFLPLIWAYLTLI